MKLQSKPYQLLLPIFALLLLLSLFQPGGATIDLHLYDTYFVIAISFILMTFAGFIILLWGIYELTNKFLLSIIITWIHVAITIFAVVTLVAIPFWDGMRLYPRPRRYVDYSEFDSFQWLNSFIAAVAMAFLFAQLLFIVNLLGGLIRKLLDRRVKH